MVAANNRRQCERYILKDGRPVECPDLLAWATWFEVAANRRVAQDHVGRMTVSTVFLAIDHSFGRQGPPILYETMIFGLGPTEEYREQYATMEGALAGHAKAVEEAKRLQRGGAA